VLILYSNVRASFLSLRFWEWVHLQRLEQQIRYPFHL
jgi:hypothetical protein